MIELRAVRSLLGEYVRYLIELGVVSGVCYKDLVVFNSVESCEEFGRRIAR